MSSVHTAKEQALRKDVEKSERVLDILEADLRSVDDEIEALAQRNHKYELLEQVCCSLEDLDGLGAAHLFWGNDGDADVPVEHIQYARRKIDEFGEEIRLWIAQIRSQLEGSLQGRVGFVIAIERPQQVSARHVGHLKTVT